MLIIQESEAYYLWVEAWNGYYMCERVLGTKINSCEVIDQRVLFNITKFY